ncbi:ABC transporter permease [Ornithinicoccus halotolerans]|uniref:ABC transporter permease n=1 Tax=Ornithinicoccus halotolerans TaxID=1748220 RepID=UPI001294C403|nr:ABC transporter permease [Ornithinicoccus halotolerans]
MNGRRSLPRRVILAELVKLGSLPSSIWFLATTSVVIVGFGVYGAIGQTVQEDMGLATYDPLGGTLGGISSAAVVVGTLGGLFVTGEYINRMVRTTFSAVPRRWEVVLAKAVAVAAATFLVVLASLALTLGAAALILGNRGMSLALGAPGAARALVGSALFLALVGVIGVALGWLLRSTAGVLTAIVGLLYVLPIISILLPRSVGEHVIPYLPNNAGVAVMQLESSGLLTPWTGFGLFAAYALLALALAAAVIEMRDT